MNAIKFLRVQLPDQLTLERKETLTVRSLNVFMAQLNHTVGALEQNCGKIAEAYAGGIAAGADLVLTPELSVTGYPPEDLVLKPFFQRMVQRSMESLAALTEDKDDPGLIVGFPWSEGEKLFNAAALLEGGKIAEIRFKCELPNYGVFDEKRIFDSGPAAMPIPFRGFKLGVMICEDMWFQAPALSLAEHGADLILVPTCSPYEVTKLDQRLDVAKARVSETTLPLLFCNQVGGQDELVFDGASFVMDADGTAHKAMDAWSEDACSVTVDLDAKTVAAAQKSQEPYAPTDYEDLYQASVIGLRDYVEKNRFPGVVLGLSGGIDSALTAAMAVDALGAEKVHCIMMPSDYTSSDSLEDAKACADALGARYDIIAIKDAVKSFDGMLAPLFEGRESDTTEENIQSRIRGVTLMAVSNKFGSMVLTTGNKSEVSVGYSTLYGDMCGGYNPLKDLYKMQVFALSRWRNTAVPKDGMGPAGEVIPERIITKPPTAELRPDQKDEDSLPPYERLDAILTGLVDEEASVADLIARGFDEDEVARVEHLLYIAEYKRRQAAPGVKVTAKIFGRDRRYPITNGFRSARQS